jgi:hypothetical protein
LWARKNSTLDQDRGLDRNIGQRGLIARDLGMINNELGGPKGILKRKKGQELPPLA